MSAGDRGIACICAWQRMGWEVALRGPGWRMYYVQRGTTLIVMLGGGEKSTQPKDIVNAIQLAETVED